MTGIWNIFGPALMPAITLDALQPTFRVSVSRGASARRSRHTVAQDRRAAKKRAALRRARARGQA